MSDKKYEEATPVFNTAKMTMYYLAKAGSDAAEDFLNRADFDEALIRNNSQIDAFQMAVIQFRHNMHNKFIFNSGCKNVLDLACGYTPRSVEVAEKGFNYIGGDLPVVVRDIDSISKPAVKPGMNVRYMPIDITNQDSMKNVADILEGKTCIITEGLLMYLADTELKETIKNIRMILKKTGGAWYTNDKEAGMLQTDIAKAFMTPEQLEAAIKNDAYTKMSDTDLASFVQDPLKATKIFEENGLLVKRVPVKMDHNEIPCAKTLFASFGPDVEKKLFDVIDSAMIWEITVNEDFEEGSDDESSDSDFRFSLEGDVLKVYVSGRIDSLNAPDFMEEYDLNYLEKKDVSITVDCSNLQYISSAGLRVLMAMRKNSGSLTVTNVNYDVMEILETTGFVSILDIV